MIGPVLQFSDLQDLCKPGGKPTRTSVERWARKCGLHYSFDADGGIWTTIDALNAAIGLKPINDGNPYHVDEVI